MSNLITTLKPFAPSGGGVKSIQSTVGCDEQFVLRITYLLQGDMPRLKIPAKCSPRRADRLWEHTCFEVFIRFGDDPSYYEFNVAPSGEWAVYWFRSYRDYGPLPSESCVPETDVRCEVDRIDFDAAVRSDRLSTKSWGANLRLGLSAVIEANDGSLSHWALKHPEAKPDFHHPDSFALEIPFPSQGA